MCSEFGPHGEHFSFESVYFGVGKKFSMELKSRGLANAFRNLFVIKEVFFSDDFYIGFFGSGEIGL